MIPILIIAFLILSALSSIWLCAVLKLNKPFDKHHD